MAWNPARQIGTAGPGTLSGFRRLPGRLDGSGNGVVFPVYYSRRPQHFGFYRWTLHISKRTSGATLRDSWSDRDGIPPRRLIRDGAQWNVDAGERFNSIFIWEPHL